MKKTYMAGILLLLVGVVFASGCVSDTAPQEEKTVNVTDLKVVSEGYGLYSVSGKITALKDYGYLEMHLNWYDSEGNLLYENPLAWNTNNAKTGQTIKFKAEDYIDTGKPARVEILIYGTPFGGSESDLIYNNTIKV
ncbi:MULTISPECIES: hypothetical protein [Methanothermobacter]|uniref:Uncharacterized protein n=1 Tax=Methanothermobacter wolfeii TaxID=145261 RepID=A0A9E7RUR1_METWO|nr:MULTISPECIES: hypothetical protein [Methanothermobacter]MDI6701534.1 hypothetical protein [Methanothermobacter wolfeii]MDI6841636.1 hypothetical protein [Methanothermobacter wolfeii]NLM02389.1 hypothetical protein [Methanothermobacter wolfeii]QHN06357.1 hypothetical protein FZP57_04260 [Methanothermobacter sp. THM-1]UXH32559.1 hypothetical protein N5910_04575 [Methanothermobacter wolfeii]